MASGADALRFFQQPISCGSVDGQSETRGSGHPEELHRNPPLVMAPYPTVTVLR